MQCRIAVFCWRSPAVHSLFTLSRQVFLNTGNVSGVMKYTFCAFVIANSHFSCTHTLKPVSDQQCSVQHDTPTGSPPEGEAVMRNYWYKMVREFQNTHTRKRPLKHPPLLWHLHCVYTDCVVVKRLSGKNMRRFAGYRWTRRSGTRQEQTSIFVVSFTLPLHSRRFGSV